MTYCRTDANKHMGLSVLIVDLKSPGITMRRIAQATGIPAFCEVFFDNVKVPKENLLGKKKGGWRYCSSRLERSEPMGSIPYTTPSGIWSSLSSYAKEHQGRGWRAVEPRIL